ncbi:hypothetical protein [Sphingomonas gellani]|uniref:hypothetical protein n=1 Tax=Sphingomonas gellani TaxID=1166340 RepID=UPI001113E588|nr:hypothetical protein [Sphingomonas gellani]
MRVHSVCGYPGNSAAWANNWEPEHWRARNLVKGVKREPFNGYAEWVRRPGNTRVRQYSDAAGQRLALQVAGSRLVDLIDAAGITHATIVPVPSSQTIASGGDFTGARLAAALQARRPNLIAAPVLHFDQPQPRAHEGVGERRWHMILPHLRGGAGLGGRILLLDDVMTGGGHLRACRRFLAGLGHEVDHAFVVGRTVWDRPAGMFTIPAETLAY